MRIKINKKNNKINFILIKLKNKIKNSKKFKKLKLINKGYIKPSTKKKFNKLKKIKLIQKKLRKLNFKKKLY